MTISRRGFLGSIIAAACAPAIIRTPGLLMPIKPVLVGVTGGGWSGYGGATATTWTIEGLDFLGNRFIETMDVKDGQPAAFQTRVWTVHRISAPPQTRAQMWWARDGVVQIGRPHG